MLRTLPDTAVHNYRKCELTVLCCCVVRVAAVENASCTLFRCLVLLGRSYPAVNIDTYIRRHHLHAGRYLFRLQRHAIVDSITHERESEKIIYAASIFPPGSCHSPIAAPITFWMSFCKHYRTQRNIIIKATLSCTSCTYSLAVSLCLLSSY